MKYSTTTIPIKISIVFATICFDFFTFGYSTQITLIMLISWLIAVVVGIVFHEFAHSFVAYKR